MSETNKKDFFDLLNRAITPPSAGSKARKSGRKKRGGYTAKRTRQRNPANASAKRSGKSR